jgi:nitrite reductase (NADH) small subunit
MSNWLRICRLDDIPPLGSRVVRREGETDIAVFRTADDKVFALADKCPHKGGALSQHNWNIALATGCAIAPDEGSTRTYPVRVEGGMVMLEIKTLAHA